jgi:hypothetical protein
VLGAYAPDGEDVRVVRVLHVMYEANIDALTHFAKLRRLSEIVYVNAGPAALGNARL